MKFIVISLLYSLFAVAQDRPNRIGDFIVNETTLTDFYSLYSYSSIYPTPIDNVENYSQNVVPYDQLDDEYAGGIFCYEIKPDYSNPKSWYNAYVANLDESVKVFFIPNYQTDGVIIKNLLVKFVDDKLFFIRASLSKTYKEIILEKYKGKGHEINKKKTPHKCAAPSLKKYSNSYSEYFFTSSEDQIRAILYFDMKITKTCELIIDDKIEIFDFDLFIADGEKFISLAKDRQKQNDERIEQEKAERLKKF